jgi:hypothetical protein
MSAFGSISNATTKRRDPTKNRTALLCWRNIRALHPWWLKRVKRAPIKRRGYCSFEVSQIHPWTAVLLSNCAHFLKVIKNTASSPHRQMEADEFFTELNGAAHLELTCTIFLANGMPPRVCRQRNTIKTKREPSSDSFCSSTSVHVLAFAPNPIAAWLVEWEFGSFFETIPRRASLISSVAKTHHCGHDRHPYLQQFDSQCIACSGMEKTWI